MNKAVKDRGPVAIASMENKFTQIDAAAYAKEYGRKPMLNSRFPIELKSRNMAAQADAMALKKRTELLPRLIYSFRKIF